MIVLTLYVNKVNLIDLATNTSNRVFSNNHIKFSRMQLMKIQCISHDVSKKKKNPWLSRTVCSISHDFHDSHDSVATLLQHDLHITYKSNQRSCSVKKVFLETSQNSQENTCARDSFLIKLQGWGLQLY